MQPTASPRHPWKALAVVLLMFALFHGARAHVGSYEHEHGSSHIHVVHGDAFDRDCPDVEIDVDDDDPDDGPVIDVFDDEEWD